MGKLAAHRAFWHRTALLALLLSLLAGCAELSGPPQRPLTFEPVAAWWHYFPELSDGEWDYFTQRNNVREPVLAQLRPSQNPLIYRMGPNNESAVNSYNARETRQQQAKGEQPPPVLRHSTVRQQPTRPSAPARRVQLTPDNASNSQPWMQNASNKATLETTPTPKALAPVAAAPLSASAQRPQAGSFAIQMGQYESEAEAAEVKQRLWAMGFSSFQRQEKSGGGKAMVVIGAGPFANRQEADRQMASLQEKLKRVEGRVSFPVEVIPYTP